MIWLQIEVLAGFLIVIATGIELVLGAPRVAGVLLVLGGILLAAVQAAGFFK